MKYEPRYKFIRDDRRLNIENYITHLRSLPLSIVYALDDASDQISVLNNLITECIDRHAPLWKVKITRPPSPWLKDPNISMLQRARNAAKVNYKNEPSHRHHEGLKTIRNQLKKSIKETKRTFLKKLLLNKDSSETLKVITKILHPNSASVKVNPDEVNSFFNRTAIRTTGREAGRITDEFFLYTPRTTKKIRSTGSYLRRCGESCQES